MKKLLSFGILSFVLSSSFAQNLTYYSMTPDVFSIPVRPEIFPEEDYYFSVPVLGSMKFAYTNSGFTYRNLFKRRSDDSLVLDMDNAISKMNRNNFLAFEGSMEILGLGFKSDDYFFTFSIRERFSFGFHYPKEFIELLDRGNAPFIGQTLTFENLALDIRHYREYALGFSQMINERLSFGMKLKYLNGMMNITTDNKDISFTTAADDYAMMLTTDVVVNTSAHFIADEGENTSAGKYLFGNDNHGLGIDIGSSYEMNDETTISLSLLDLGFIKWNDNLTNYRTASGTYTFNGIDIQQFIDDTTANIETVIDSLEETYNSEAFSESYTTGLHSQVFAGIQHKFDSDTYGGALLHMKFFKGIILPSVTISAGRQLTEGLNMTVSYSYTNRNFENLGLGLSLKAKAFNFFFVTDNILGLAWPKHFHSTAFRTGISFAWKKQGSTANDRDTQ